MKLSEVFLEAAKFISRKSPSRAPGMCGAIAEVCPRGCLVAIRFMTNLFSPEDKGMEQHRWYSTYWFTTNKGDQRNHYVKNLREAKRRRIDVLIWCATIAEAEGL